MQCPNQSQLDKIFPPERANEFFDAIFGDVDEGAYDIRLTCQSVTANEANLAFDLVRRPDKCLACSLTYGLPGVFQRHPIIKIAHVAEAVGHLLGWNKVSWELQATREISEDLHQIPFTIRPA